MVWIVVPVVEPTVKTFVRKVFGPILRPFASGTDEYNYRASYRKILLGVGSLFLILSAATLAMSLHSGLYGGLIPAVFFGVSALVCVVVGLLGEDKAVARIWKSR